MSPYKRYLLWARANPEKIDEHKRRDVAKLKDQFFNAYGNKCECCHEKERQFLTLEHKYYDGSKHRKKVGTGNQVFRDLRRRGWPKDRYGLLCYNCNIGTKDGRKCPHQLKEIKWHKQWL